MFLRTASFLAALVLAGSAWAGSPSAASAGGAKAGVKSTGSQAKKPGAPKPTANGIQDCGTDLRCFQDAARNCKPARVERDLSLGLMGVERKRVVRQEITGFQGARCVMRATVVRSEYRRGKDFERMRSMAMRQGATAEQLAKGEADAKRKAAEQVGKLLSVCRAFPPQLAQEVASWRDGGRGPLTWELGRPEAGGPKKQDCVMDAGANE